jgi:hypothetical protein
VRKAFSTLFALLLTGTVWLDRCVSCRTLAAQEPVHDCCKQGSCHRDSGQQPAGKQCPHQALALENYAKVEVDPGAVVAGVPLDTGSGLPLLPGPRVTAAAAPLLVHSPPDLYLRNSTLLI